MRITVRNLKSEYQDAKRVAMDTSRYQSLIHGISSIDTGLGRPGLAACYLMEHQGRLAIIETGTTHTVPAILDLIQSHGYEREAVDLVIVTHVHLDHAGGAGALMQALPNAKLVVHPRGARHMIEPSKLQAGAIAVYGSEYFQENYGELIPVPEESVIIADNQFTLSLGDRQLKFFDTPGHAFHHFCVFDSLSKGVFSGDTMGVVYKELCENGKNFILPTTTPVQFEPNALKASVDLLMGLYPEYFFLTHYGMVEASQAHAQQFKEHIDAYVDIALQCQSLPDRQMEIQHALTNYTLTQLMEFGSSLSAQRQRELLEGDLRLNAQGLDVWLTYLENQESK